MREECRCEVLLRDCGLGFVEDLPNLATEINLESLILVVIKEIEHYREECQAVIKAVRERLSADLPIVVIPDDYIEESFVARPEEKIYTFCNPDPELPQFVGELANKWRLSRNWLGAVSKAEQGLLMGQLEDSYRCNYLGQSDENDNRMFGVPDSNHMIVAQALRIKILPSEFLKVEFDDTLEEVVHVFVPIPTSVYEQERERICSLDDAGREALWREMLAVKGEVTFGNNISGFAIDPETLEWITICRFALHRYVRTALSFRICNIGALRGGPRYLSHEEEEEIEWRLFTGFVFSGVSGFQTPILKLENYGRDDGEISRVARFLREQQKFLPIIKGGFLFGG